LFCYFKNKLNKFNKKILPEIDKENSVEFAEETPAPNTPI